MLYHDHLVLPRKTKAHARWRGGSTGTISPVFERNVKEFLVPELNHGDVINWDHLKPKTSEEAIEVATASLVPLPP